MTHAGLPTGYGIGVQGNGNGAFIPESRAGSIWPTLIRTYHPGASSRPQVGPQNFP